jgi:hypothetical protein
MRFRFAIIPTIISIAIMFVPGFAIAKAPNPTCYNVQGYSAETIKAVQTALKVYVDGQLGPQTCSALISYQQQKHDPPLDVNGTYGYLGLKTLTALGVNPVVIAPAKGVWPSQCKASTPCIVISQGANHAWFGSKGTGIIAETGIVDNPSPSKLPKGVYRIGYKKAAGITDEHGTLDLDNYMSFYGDVAFHKVPRYISTGKPIHSETKLGQAGMKSSGCIRVSSVFSDTIFAQAPVWTYVVVI